MRNILLIYEVNHIFILVNVGGKSHPAWQGDFDYHYKLIVFNGLAAVLMSFNAWGDFCQNWLFKKNEIPQILCNTRMSFNVWGDFGPN